MVNKFLKSIEFILLFLMIFLVFTPFESKSAEWLFYGNYIFIISLLIISFFLSKFRFKFNLDLILVLLIFILIFGFSAIGGENSSYGYFLVLNLSLLFGFVFFSYLRVRVDLVIQTLKIYILFNFIAITYQFIYFFIFQDIFSFHSLVFPFSEDRGAIVSKVDLGRFSGFHNEPGTYGTWMSFAIIALIILEKKPSVIAYLGIFSLLITLSATSMVYFILLTSILILEKIKNKKFISLMIFFFCFLILSYTILFNLGLFEYFRLRFFDSDISNDGTTALKILAFEHLLNSEDKRFLLGSGFGINDCYNCFSLQDNGLAFNLFFYFGIFFIPIIFLILKIAKPNNMYHWLAIILIFVSKASIYNCAIWVLLFIIRSSRNR